MSDENPDKNTQLLRSFGGEPGHGLPTGSLWMLLGNRLRRKRVAGLAVSRVEMTRRTGGWGSRGFWESQRVACRVSLSKSTMLAGGADAPP